MKDAVKFFTIPNQDVYARGGTVYPRDVELKGYIDIIGKTIRYLDEVRTVVSVKITKDNIIIELD
jgi:hypothetical protein